MLQDKVENPAKKPRLSDDARQESPSKGTNGRRPSDSPTKSPNKDRESFISLILLFLNAFAFISVIFGNTYLAKTL